MKTIKDFAFHGCDNNIIVNSDNKFKNVKFGVNNDVISNYFVLPEIGVTFDELSWHKINMISEQGLAENYFNIRDIKEFQIGDEIYHVQILGFDHDDKSDGTGKVGITVGLKEVITTTKVMNSSYSNKSGWKDSKMRTYLNETVHNSLPSDLQTVIKTVNKVSDNGGMNTTTLKTTQDKLFLLSFEEVGFTSSDVDGYYVDGQGIKYEYFIDDSSRIKKCLSGELSDWWLRSAGTYYANGFFDVFSNGDWIVGGANYARGVSPAFCI